jgi:WD40 repeat protein
MLQQQPPRIWDALTGLRTHKFATPNGDVRCLQTYALPDGRVRLAGGLEWGTLVSWDGETATEEWQAGACEPDALSCLCVYYSPQERKPRVVSGGANGSVDLWKGGTGDLLRTFEGFDRPVTSLSSYARTDDGQPRVVGAAAGGRVRVYDPEQGATLHTLEWPTAGALPLSCLSIPGGPPLNCLITARTEAGAAVWGETGRQLQTLEAHGGTSLSTLVGYCEPRWGHGRIAGGSPDGTILVWSVPDARLLNTLVGHSAEILCLFAYESAGGDYWLFSGSADHTMKIWEPEEGSLLHTLSRAHMGILNLACIDSGGVRYLATGDSNGCLRVWKLEDAPPPEAMRSAIKKG